MGPSSEQWQHTGLLAALISAIRDREAISCRVTDAGARFTVRTRLDAEPQHQWVPTVTIAATQVPVSARGLLGEQMSDADQFLCSLAGPTSDHDVEVPTVESAHAEALGGVPTGRVGRYTIEVAWTEPRTVTIARILAPCHTRALGARLPALAQALNTTPS